MAIVAKKNKTGGRPHGGAPERRGIALAAAVLVALVALLAWRWASARSESSPHLAGNEDVAPHVTSGATAAPATSAPETPHPAPEGAADTTKRVPPEHAAARSESSPNQTARTKPGPPTMELAPALPEPPAPAANADGKVFDNPVENNLESVSQQNFESIVTLRVDLPQDEIVEILKRPVEIYDDDDEETVAAKERTAEMKSAALEYIEAGGTFNQFLRDCQAEANEAREAVKDVQEEMKRILEAEGVEAAQAYLDEQNPRLREQGLREVHIGAGLIRAIERRRARLAEQGK